jgi:hypothetical protein
MHKQMKTHGHLTAELGELVVAAFDEAARYSQEPLEVARLATEAIALILQRAAEPLAPRRRELIN